MRRAPLLWVVGGLILAVLAGRSAPAGAAEPAWSGTWVLTFLPENGIELDILLLKIEEKDGSPRAEVLSAGIPVLKGTKVESIKIEDKALKLALKGGSGLALEFVAPLGKEDKPQKLYGALSVNEERTPAELKRSDLAALDPAKTLNKTAAEALVAVSKVEGDEAAEKALKGFIEKYADRPVAAAAGLHMLELLIKRGAPEEEIKKVADAAVKVAERYGPEPKAETLRGLAQKLAAGEKTAALAVAYARQARQALPENAAPGQKAPVLRVLAAALRKAGKDAEAKEVDATLAKMDEELDREFLKTAVPFKPDAFAGRKGKSSRVVVVELFTGAECPPCVAADVAFDGLLQTYKPSDVVLLQYHLHIPRPDPLTNADSEKRSEYYEVEGTPTAQINGKGAPSLGGGKAQAEVRYTRLCELLNEALETDAGAALKLTAARKGDKVDLEATVTGLKKTGDKVRLRFVLVEEVVRYPGGNRQRLHHHVVRAFPGGVSGFALKEESAKQSVAVDLAEVARGIEKYLTDYQKSEKFRTDYQPLDPRKLKVAALIQDDATKEILQAAQVEVPDGK